MDTNKTFRNIPSIDSLLKRIAQKSLCNAYGPAIVTFAARAVADELRAVGDTAGTGLENLDADVLDEKIGKRVRSILGLSFTRVINATGIVLHTNLGRAVLGNAVLSDISDIVKGYSTIEMDLARGKRGNRNDYISELLCFLTGAQKALVVNNNAAGIILTLSTLAKKREVIVSRGELIEIGGEFRIPEIMALSGCKMVEVGATNRTRIEDYEKAITDKTALIFKAHKSNYNITGFVEEASLEQCARCAHTHNLAFVYDIGSGLIKKPPIPGLETEPDVFGAISAQADIVLFSGDKLLGGPQAGIVAGKSEYITRLAKSPLMRALRVGKLTMAALLSACRSYLTDETLREHNPVFALLSQKSADIRIRAEMCARELASKGIACKVIETVGQCGGGTLPNISLQSFGIVLDIKSKNRAMRNKDSKTLLETLLRQDMPVVAILREGDIVLDMLSVDSSEISGLCKSVVNAIKTYDKR